MNTTINISLPKQMYQEAKKVMTDNHYSSVSELIRDALRGFLSKKQLTENGFTEEFEDLVLESAAEPENNDYILETEEEMHNYFKHRILPTKKK